ncbi:hypothetical protein OAC63_03095 [Amylibacter sp.]|jgi:hypothetical protein|nr:hypothetical protein [Amylibacter sp.]MDB9857357.1 hypothetical protein [Amylibacter sp.]
MIGRLVESATIELVAIGIVIAFLVMGWMFTSGFIDEWGPLLGFLIAITIGTILPALYILNGLGGL